VPAEFHSGNPAEEGRAVVIPCDELFSSNAPRLPLGRLHDLLPDLISLPEGTDRESRLCLPAGWLALHFRLVTKREELPPEPTLEIIPAPAASSELHKEEKLVVEKKDALPESDEKAEEQPAATNALVAAVDMPSTETGELAPPATDAVPASEPRKGFFSRFALFRRRQEEPPASLEIQELPDEAQTPTERPDIDPAGLATAPVPANERTLSPHWKLDPQVQLAEPSALQSLFMTEEKLTLDRVISMAGQLPGMRACVLAHGERVISASNTSAGVDLRTLSGHAMKMLSQIRESSSQMGLGSVPAVTLHADQGIVSFLHDGELCLLVLHADRGFVPGVRERLQEMLGLLVKARLALPERSPAAETRGSRDESR
jgi:predicted regulator of Ras-like GTPase activity (Roadblock/LC7/MglB family)